jgi:hypothetical protein
MVELNAVAWHRGSKEPRRGSVRVIPAAKRVTNRLYESVLMNPTNEMALRAVAAATALPPNV